MVWTDSAGVADNKRAIPDRKLIISDVDRCHVTYSATDTLVSLLQHRADRIRQDVAEGRNMQPGECATEGKLFSFYAMRIASHGKARLYRWFNSSWYASIR